MRPRYAPCSSLRAWKRDNLPALMRKSASAAASASLALTWGGATASAAFSWARSSRPLRLRALRNSSTVGCSPLEVGDGDDMPALTTTTPGDAVRSLHGTTVARGWLAFFGPGSGIAGGEKKKGEGGSPCSSELPSFAG